MLTWHLSGIISLFSLAQSFFFRLHLCFNYISLADPDVFLPESLTTLEWLNRSGHFLVVMPKLKSLVNLEYLMLGHAEFSNSEEFDAFLTTISSENLPRLQYLVSCFFNNNESLEGDIVCARSVVYKVILLPAIENQLSLIVRLHLCRQLY